MNKEMMETLRLGKFVEAVEQNKCPICGNEIVISEFKDPVSLREYEISGICQECQDKIFN